MKRILLTLLFILSLAGNAYSAVFDDANADWRQSGTTGTEQQTDSSTNSYDMTISGTTPLTSIADHDANANSSIDYNGTDQFMSTSSATDIQNITTGDFSFTCWFKYTTVGTDMFWTIQNISTVYKMSLYGEFSTGDLTFQISTTDTTGQIFKIETAGNLSADTWYNCTGVRTGTNLKIWLTALGETFSSIPDVDSTITGNTLVSGASTHIAFGLTAFPIYHDGAFDRLTFWLRALTVGEVEEVFTGVVANSIAIDEPGDVDQIVARDSAGQVSQALTGSYTGSLTAVEVALLRHSDDVIVQVNGSDWNTLSSASVGGGVWSGTLNNIPSPPINDWYYFRVRKSLDTGVVGETTRNYGVGVLIGEAGQSNPYRMGSLGTGTPISTIRKFNGTNWTTVTGSGDIELCNLVSNALGCPVGIINGGVGGSSLIEANELSGSGYWSNAGTEDAVYTNFISNITAAGGKLNYFIWWQSASDEIGDINSGVGYKAAEIAFMSDQIRTDIEYAETGTLPAMVVLACRWSNTGFTITDADHTQVADWKTENWLSGVFQGITTAIDLTEDQPGHLFETGYDEIGKRIARWVEYEEGLQTSYRGPRITGGIVINSTTTDITVDLDYGTDFTPTSAIDSFDVNIGTVGTPNWVTATGVRQSATTVRLTHASGTVVQSRSMYGTFDATTPTAFILKDNSALAVGVFQSGGVAVSPSVSWMGSNLKSIAGLDTPAYWADMSY